MKNTQINRKATMEVAKALGDLNKKVVFVGGAVVSLYVDDPAADDVRPTKDVDLSFEVLTVSQLEQLRSELNKKGFTQSHEDQVVCRFRLDEKKVDVMSTHKVGWAPSNRWFKPGFQQAVSVELDDIIIKIMPFVYFLAAKFDAFKSRGSIDARTSHDFEDIVYLLNYTSDFLQLFAEADMQVRTYLRKCFEELSNKELLQEAVISHLYNEDREARFNYIMKQLKEATDSN